MSTGLRWFIKPIEFYKRFRHTCGFGIHSPFAFTLIRDVIQEHCRYYAYDILDVLPTNPGGMHKRCVRMTHRFAARFQWGKITFGPGLPSCYEDAVEMACSNSYRQGDNSLFIYGANVPKHVLEQLSSASRNIVACIIIEPSEKARTEIEASIKNGIFFEGVNALIAISRCDIAPVKYTILV